MGTCHSKRQTNSKQRKYGVQVTDGNIFTNDKCSYYGSINKPCASAAAAAIAPICATASNAEDLRRSRFRVQSVSEHVTEEDSHPQPSLSVNFSALPDTIIPEGVSYQSDKSDDVDPAPSYQTEHSNTDASVSDVSAAPAPADSALYEGTKTDSDSESESNFITYHTIGYGDILKTERFLRPKVTARSVSVDNLLKLNTLLNSGKKSDGQNTVGSSGDTITKHPESEGVHETSENCSNNPVKETSDLSFGSDSVEPRSCLDSSASSKVLRDNLAQQENCTPARSRLQAVRCSSFGENHFGVSFRSDRSANESANASFNESVMYHSERRSITSASFNGSVNTSYISGTPRKQTDVSSGTRSNTSYLSQPSETTSVNYNGNRYKEVFEAAEGCSTLPENNESFNVITSYQGAKSSSGSDGSESGSVDHTAYHTIGYGYKEIHRPRVTRCASLDDLFNNSRHPSPQKDAAPTGPSSADFKRKKYVTLGTSAAGDHSLSDDELNTTLDDDDSSELAIPPVPSCSRLYDVIRYHPSDALDVKGKDDEDGSGGRKKKDKGKNKSIKIKNIIRLNARTVDFYIKRSRSSRLLKNDLPAADGITEASETNTPPPPPPVVPEPLQKIHDRVEHRVQESLANIFSPTYPVDYKKLHAFELQRVLGSGSFSKVYKVKDTTTNEDHALKKVHKSQVIRQKMCYQVTQEIDILMKLKDHPFVLGVISYWQTKGYLLQLLPLADNGDLQMLWKRVKKFPIGCVAHIAAEIGTALVHIHANKIVYRDLKMENILISQSGHVLLSDFGLSKRMGKLTRTYTICGTLDYIAPEVTTGKGHAYPCDWWSLGVVIFTLATGKLPFKSADDHVAMWEIIKNSIPSLSMVTKNGAVREVIAKMLNYQAIERLSTLKEFQELQLLNDVDLQTLHTRAEGPLQKYFTSEVHSYS